MPTPITHAVVAWLHEPRAKEPGFIAGCIFPDIRCLGGVERHVSHRAPTDLGPAFFAGLACHVRTDEALNPLFGDVVSFGPNPWMAINALRLLVDEKVYGLTNEWPAIIAGLDPKLADPLPHPVPQGDIERWFALTRRYLKEPPTARTRRGLMTATGLEDARADELEMTLDRLKNDHLWHRRADEIVRQIANP